MMGEVDAVVVVLIICWFLVHLWGKNVRQWRMCRLRPLAGRRRRRRQLLRRDFRAATLWRVLLRRKELRFDWDTLSAWDCRIAASCGPATAVPQRRAWMSRRLPKCRRIRSVRKACGSGSRLAATGAAAPAARGAARRWDSTRRPRATKISSSSRRYFWNRPPSTWCHLAAE